MHSTPITIAFLIGQSLIFQGVPIHQVIFVERLLFACDEKFKETAQDYGFPSQIAAPYVFSETIVNLQKKIGSSAILNLPMYHKYMDSPNY